MTLFHQDMYRSARIVCLFFVGLSNRQVGSHLMNDHSSRSHSMLTVYIDSESVRTTFMSVLH